MKIKSENYLNYIKHNINTNNLILFHGTNYGLVDLLFKKTLEILKVDINDPFHVSKIDGHVLKEKPYILLDNISTLSLLKNKKIVLLDLTLITTNKNIETTILNAIKEGNNEFVLIIKANNLGVQSDLVKYSQSNKSSLLIPCYSDNNENLRHQIYKLFEHYNVQFSKEFINNLISKFSSDALINAGEIAKLENFLINNENISEIALFELISDNVDTNINKIIQLSCNGNVREALSQLEKIYENASTSINIIRGYVRHFKQIEKINLAVQTGQNISDAIDNIRPIIFFKDKPIMISQSNLWPLKKINVVLRRLINVEFKCKSSVYPDKAILFHFVLSTSVMAKNLIKS